MWKKKRYDIRIRLSPEDLEAIENAFGIAIQWIHDETKAQILYNLRKRIHGKAVEINRR